MQSVKLAPHPVAHPSSVFKARNSFLQYTQVIELFTSVSFIIKVISTEWSQTEKASPWFQVSQKLRNCLNFVVSHLDFMFAAPGM
jgi:hypothetical protein